MEGWEKEDGVVRRERTNKERRKEGGREGGKVWVGRERRREGSGERKEGREREVRERK